MKIGNNSLLNTGGGATAPLNMAVGFNTPALFLGHICNYAIQLVFTGAPAGTFKLQLSNDVGKNPSAESAPILTEQQSGVTNWTDIIGSDQLIAAPGNHSWQVANAGYRWVRVVWTPTGGAGSLTIATCNVKGV